MSRDGSHLTQVGQEKQAREPGPSMSLDDADVPEESESLLDKVLGWVALAGLGW